jgi:uncharacterized protein YjiS (DUF1127 family)
MLSWLSTRLNAYGQYRTVKRELYRLTDKDLADIGISRCDIESIACSTFKNNVSRTNS